MDIYMIKDAPPDAVCGICDAELHGIAFCIKIDSGIYEMVCKQCADLTDWNGEIY